LCHHFEVHSTPKHCNWLNRAEIELSILDRQGLSLAHDSPVAKVWEPIFVKATGGMMFLKQEKLSAASLVLFYFICL
jgi:hypothetical protein